MWIVILSIMILMGRDVMVYLSVNGEVRTYIKTEAKKKDSYSWSNDLCFDFLPNV